VTTLAIVHPANLLGRNLRERLERRRQLWQELRLFTTRVVEADTLTEVRGAAAMVRQVEPEDLEGVEVAFFCGDMPANRRVLAELPSETTAILLSPDATRGDGLPVVDGVNLEAATAGQVLVSPHPGAIALAHLIHPLRPLHLEAAVATLVQPASMREEEGIDELFEQTRRMLAFSDQKPTTVFGHQLAFNLLPVPGGGDHLLGHLAALFGEELELALQIVQGSVFHAFAASVYLRFQSDPGAATLRAALAGHPQVKLARGAEHLGPTDAAVSEQVLVGHIQPDPRHAGAYWLWAVMDNLTRGGAINAIAIAEAVLS
jgi:aspartate-semialdehyde dehydrogenase